MLRPSEVSIDQLLASDEFETDQRRAVVGNIIRLSRETAARNDDDRWYPFTPGEYSDFAIRHDPEASLYIAMHSLELCLLVDRHMLANEGTDHLTVTNQFLGVLAQYATPESYAAVIVNPEDRISHPVLPWHPV